MQKRVLIVEDEGDIQSVLRSIVEMAGCEVSVAANGMIALEQIEREGFPDLIFLDLMMPEMDGVAFIHTLQKHRNYVDIPIIVVSGDAEVRERVSGLGMDVFIEKPFSVDEVLDYIEALLGDVVRL